MKISPNWLREFATVKADDRQLADELTLAGIAVESVGQSSAGSTVYEMDITTNRVDAMNHYGIAREMSAIYDVSLKPLTTNLPETSGTSNFSVQIDVPQYCARFTGQEIRNVKIQPSSGAVMARFKELEQKPINNAADATNYVMLLMGKPTHAFDADKLAGGKIIVRMARPGETLKTLDGVERKLHPEDVVVADAEKAVGLAGVIGGWDTMITESTKNIFIESAWWDPAVIRKSSRRHGIHTDASHRFERGADWASCPLSCDLVAEIILQSGGELAGKQIDVVVREVGNPPVDLSRSEVLRILGKEIPAQELERILSRLGFGLTPDRTSKERRNDYIVSIPTWRLDIEREIDVIEEIARVHGYNKFSNTLPGFVGGVVEQPDSAKKEKLRTTLLALGYNEALSSTFIGKLDSQAFSACAVVEIANPLSEEASAMRTTLVPGMLAMMAHNLNRGVDDVRLFEYGHVYAMQGDTTDETPALCIGATASALKTHTGAKDATEMFRVFKGDVENLLHCFGGNLHFDLQSADYYHPGRSARAVLNGNMVAKFGQLHPEIAVALKLKQDIFIAEIVIEHLFQNGLRTPRYEKLSRFPAVERDFSFVFSDAVTFEKIDAAFRTLKMEEICAHEPVEIFREGNVPVGKYSLLLRVSFQSHNRTLRDDEVAEWSSKIIRELENLGGTKRA